MNYPMFSNNNNPMYMQNLQSLQDMRDRIDSQMKQMQQQNQMPQPVAQPQIHQSFQLAPQTNNSEIQAKYVTSINDVKNTFVMSLGIFINKELDKLWLKNINGEIRTFNLTEIIEQDEKDIEINNLKQELENMKLLIKNVQNIDEVKESGGKNINKNVKK
ncbi:MAG: hypothetical protein IJ223_06980 [Clostridia bacterium]|nr:hypothetical protein [Clostridia bacterium]